MASEYEIGNSGSGSRYSNSYGTQYNNTGPGNQFNAEVMHFGAQNQSYTKLLADLRVTDPCDDKTRIEDIKGGLLRDSYCWILDHEAFIQWRTDAQSSLLWIRGDPGKGKTMLICGIIDELPSTMPEWETIYFFCEAADSRINNATAVLRSLLYLLLRKKSHLSKFIREDHEHAGKQLFEDANGWYVLDKTFTNILQDGGLKHVIFVIDALDECIVGFDQLIDFVVRFASSNVKVVVSSRNLQSIEEAVATVSDQVCISLELNERSISSAVDRYIRHQVDQLARLKRYDSALRDEVYDYLSSKANDTFLWVALVTVQLGKRSVPRRHTRMKLEEFPSQLDALYRRMLTRSWESMDRDRCRRILAVVSIVCRPVTLWELASVAGFADLRDDMETLEEIVGECGSLLTVKDDIIYFVHQSAKDFLLGHALKEIMPNDIDHEHNLILERSLDVMTDTCHRNIYNLEGPGASLDNVHTPVPDPLQAVRYACVYWVEHVLAAGGHAGKHQHCRIYEFFKEHLLHWLEALSLLRHTSSGISSIFKLTQVIQASEEMSEQKLFILDALRFVRYFRVAIENSPLQLYSSALMFSPTNSIIRNQFQYEVPDWIVKQPMVSDEWSLCSQTLEGHKGPVQSLACSPDGTMLASASSDKTVKLWDIMTGQYLRTLQSHENRVESVVFSIKGDMLASASRDGAVKLWDKATGRLLETFHGNPWRHPYVSVSFCACDQQVALGSFETVEVWDIATGQRVQHFQVSDRQSSLSNGVAFSADGAVFALYTKTGFALFNTETGTCSKTLDPQRTSRYLSGGSLAFCDGARLITCNGPYGLILWNTTTCQPIRTDTDVPFMDTGAMACSKNGGLIAFSVHSLTAVEIRDVETGKILQTLPIGMTPALAFSADCTQLFSSSLDGLIRIWDLSRIQRRRLNKPEISDSDVPSTAISPQNENVEEGFDTRFESVSSSSHDATRDGTTTDRNLQTFDNYYTLVIAVAFSEDGKQLASLSRSSFRIWDFTTGQCLETTSSRNQLISTGSLTYFRNGFQFAQWDDASHIKISDAATGVRLKEFKAYTGGMVVSAAFSNDGLILALSLRDQTIKLWDVTLGECKVTFIVPEVVRYLRFSESGSQLITDIGNIDIEFLSATSAQLSTSRTPDITSSQGFMLSIEDRGAWVQKDSQPILWIPPEYRPLSAIEYDVRGSAIALGCRSGRVLMLELSSDFSAL